MAEQLGVSIMAWNRPHYLKQLLDSLAANDLTGVDVHLWQDGAVCSKTGKQLTEPQRVAESAQTFEAAPLPSKTVHLQERNIGCAGHRATLMPWMAAHYRWFICLDDDVVVSPHHIALTRKLLAQFDGDERVASISPGFRLLCPENEWHDNLDAVMFAPGHLWAEAYWRASWARMEPWYMAYYDFVKPHPYRSFDLYQQQVAEWAEGLGVDGNASSDKALARAATLAGMRRLRLVVNRATGIGEWGMNCTPKFMREQGAGLNPYYVTDEELSIDRFRMVDAEGGT